jgi:predicted porin
MKKSLIAVAVLAAFVGTSFAQTNVSIYGVVDAGLSYTDNGAAANSKTLGLGSGQQSGSRLGFKGSEDLGGGLSAIFTLENGFNVDDGTQGQGRLFGRQAFVGLSGGFGSVKLGRQYNPIRGAAEAIDPFGLGLAGDLKRVFNVYGERADNTINYTTPNLSGFSGQFAYSFGEVAGSTSAGRQLGLSGSYANGPLFATLAYHYRDNSTDALVDKGSAKSTLLGATYNFGVAKLHGGFAWNKGDTGVTDNVDSRDWMLGVSAPLGSGTVLASYIQHKDKLTDDADAKQWALGYTYNLSKRTNLYTSYAKINNDANAKIVSAVAGGSASTFNVGLRHKF